VVRNFPRKWNEATTDRIEAKGLPVDDESAFELAQLKVAVSGKCPKQTGDRGGSLRGTVVEEDWLNPIKCGLGITTAELAIRGS